MEIGTVREKGIIKTNNLVALSYIIDEFDSFCLDFISLNIRNRDIKGIAMTLNKLATGIKTFADKHTKEFYKKYQTQLFNISNHVPVYEFIMESFNEFGEVNEDVKMFHRYLAANRTCAYVILDVLYRITKLEIDYVILDPDFKFNNNIYEISKAFTKNKSLYYVDNIKPLPSYNKDIAKYTTTDSNYEIKVVPAIDRIHPEESKIRLNSLTFNSDRLPMNLSKYVLFDSIVDLCNSIEKENQQLRESVDFGIATMDLEKVYLATLDLLKTTPHVANNNKLINALELIKEGIQLLDDVSVDYDREVSNTNKDVTQELIENERNALLILRANK